jgi:hypothetical protein
VTGTFIAPTSSAGAFDTFVGNPAAMQAHVIVDVVGYFTPPTRAGNGLRVQQTTGSLADAPNIINGSVSNTAGGSGVQGATVAGGGDTASDCYEPSTGAFTRNCRNAATASFATVGGGRSNFASGYASTVGGGNSNTASGNASTVGGGYANTASGVISTVGGGDFNTASGYGSTVGGGLENTAIGDYSFAAGHRAKATRDGQFVWADSRVFEFNPETNGSFGGGTNLANTFNVRATGGVEFVSGINSSTGAQTSGCYILPSGTGWSCYSNRHMKHSVRAVQPREVLAKLVAMPVATWSMLGSSVRQMGPMSQDFKRAFGLGAGDTHINSVDAQGVAFAAIQGLNQKLIAEGKAKDAKIAALEKKAAELDTLKTEFAALKKKLGL